MVITYLCYYWLATSYHCFSSMGPSTPRLSRSSVFQTTPDPVLSAAGCTLHGVFDTLTAFNRARTPAPSHSKIRGKVVQSGDLP